MCVKKYFNTLTCSLIRHSFRFEIDLLVTYHYRRACFIFQPVDFEFLSTPFTASFSGNNFRHFESTLAGRWLKNGIIRISY